MDDVSIALEHVDLLNGRDRLGVEFLQGLLQLLVVAGGSLRGTLDLSPGSSLATTYLGFLLDSRAWDGLI